MADPEKVAQDTSVESVSSDSPDSPDSPENVSIDPAVERALVRKTDLILMPALGRFLQILQRRPE